MVYLILTRAAFDELRPVVRPNGGDAVWVSAGVLTDGEADAARAAGWDLTTFSDRVGPGDVAGAIETIREHHPGQVIWAEAPAAYPG